MIYLRNLLRAIRGKPCEECSAREQMLAAYSLMNLSEPVEILPAPGEGKCWVWTGAQSNYGFEIMDHPSTYTRKLRSVK